MVDKLNGSMVRSSKGYGKSISKLMPFINSITIFSNATIAPQINWINKLPNITAMLPRAIKKFMKYKIK